MEKKARGGWLRELGVTGVILLVGLSARSSLADHYHVPSGSMLPTVEIGDRIFVDKAAYGLRVPFTSWALTAGDVPQRGDVVVLRSPVDGRTLLKRLVGVPGDEIEVRKGQVFLEERPQPVAAGLEQLGARAHPVRMTRGGGPDFAPRKIPPEHYLVMGDNRGESLDGRSFGLVRRDALLGRAVAVYYRDGFSWMELNP